MMVRPSTGCTRTGRGLVFIEKMTTDLTNIPPDFSVLVSGVLGPEGPAIDSEGRLHLVSAEDASIIRVSSDGEVTQVATTDGRPNGLVFNKAGEMFVADAERVGPISDLENYDRVAERFN